jgi:drug/metabolite transporter (DMT)-like permease
MSSSFFRQIAHWLHRHPHHRAIGYMMISTAGFSAMSVGVRLGALELNATLIVTLRNLITLLMLLPWALRDRAALIRTTRIRAHAWRGILGSVGMITWTYCLTIMPLAHATALSFTAPLFATLFAILFLKEKATRARIIALIIGFLGTLIILRPNPEQFEWNSLIVMFATSAWAITGLFVKSLSRTEPPMRMVFYMNFFMFLVALPFGLIHWQWPSAYGWAILFFIACCSITMHFSMAKAYALAPLVTLLPLDFMRLVYTSIFAYVIFGETSDFITWAGAAIIIASTAIIARRDAKALNLDEP